MIRGLHNFWVKKINCEFVYPEQSHSFDWEMSLSSIYNIVGPILVHQSVGNTILSWANKYIDLYSGDSLYLQFSWKIGNTGSDQDDTRHMT